MSANRLIIQTTALILLCAPLWAQSPGDSRKIEFLPFLEAQAKAKRENRLLFVKPVYGGIDKKGAADYRCGSW